MSIQSRIVREDDGSIVLLADVPNAGGAVLRKTGSRIGNKRHDSASGKFTKGKKAKPGASTPNVDPAEFERMRAAARDAAREFDVFDEGDIKEFLAGRAKDSSKVDLQQFTAMVRAQRVSDMADLLDQQLRATGSMKQGRRKVRLTAPRGFTRKALKDITAEEARIIVSALTARGHTEEEAAKFFDSKGIKKVEFSDYEYEESTSEGG